MAQKSVAEQAIIIPPIETVTFDVWLVGDSPLVVHAMSEKARKELGHTESKQGKGPKALRDPMAEATACLHLTNDGEPGFPTRAFKASAGDAAMLLDNLHKSTVRRLLFVHGEVAPLIAPDGWTMREDVCRLSGPSRTPDVRWRPQFWPWAVKLTVTTQPNLLPPEAVVNLFNWAGAFIGVGEDRPGKSGGDWGRFHVETDEPQLHRGEVNQ